MAITPNYDLDVDTSLGGSSASDYVIPSQKAIKTYVDNNSGYPSNYVTTDTDQNITGVKTYVGQKRIGFKQSGTSDKLGFTLYNNSNVEKGYLEYNPSNTVDSVPLMTLGNYATATAGLTHVGFRKYSSISGANGAYNLLAPLISDAKTPFNLTTTYTNFYLPLGFTNGTTTVLTAKSGLVNISTLLPTVPTNISAFTNDSGYITGITSSMVTTALGYTPYNSTNPSGYQANVIETIKVNNVAQTVTSKAVNITVPSAVTESTVSGWGFTKNVGTVTSVNNTQPDASGNVTLTVTGGANTDLSNLSSTGEAHFQAPLVSGTNIKTINSTSLLGSGDIDTSEIFVAEFNTTTYADVLAQYNAGKSIFTKVQAYGKNLFIALSEVGQNVFYFVTTFVSPLNGNDNCIYTFTLNASGWDYSVKLYADNTLSNVSSIDSGSAVATALNGKADTDLSNLSASGKTVINGDWVYSYTQLQSGVSPKASTPLPISLSSYLPNDNYKYEVIIGCALTSGTSVSALNNCIISSDIITEGIRVCQVVCQVANKTNSNAAAITLPVGTGRSLSMARNNNWNGSTSIFVYGYRRIGTNQ